MREKTEEYMVEKINVSTKLPPRRRGFSLESFIVGTSNRFAHAAALTIIENEKRGINNPLILYGKTGVGKTHLLSGIRRAWRNKYPDLPARFISAEFFTNTFLSAIYKNDKIELKKFKDWLRDSRLLLIDELPFLERKLKTQEEFLTIIDELLAKRIPIVCASNSLPKDMNLDIRLTSRLSEGLIAPIKPVDECVKNILLSRLIDTNKETSSFWSDEVKSYVVTQVNGDARLLIGSFQALSHLASIDQKLLTIETAAELLSCYMDVEIVSKALSLESIERAVENHFGFFIDPNNHPLRAKSRSREIVFPRQVAMYLARELLPDASLEDIGSHFGGRDHTTVMYAYRLIKGRLTAPETSNEIKRINDQICSSLKCN